MIFNNNHIVIFKNDAVGDLCQSLYAINNIIRNNNNKKITIFLSERSEKFSFLISNQKNIEFKKLRYDLSFFEKIKILIFFLSKKIDEIYILTPKNFYYILPFFFRKKKFYAICLNNSNNYRRPSEFLRKFLYKYTINDRSIKFKRKHTSILQNELILKKNYKNYKLDKINIKPSEYLKKILPNNYVYFHLKSNTFKKLSWSVKDLSFFFSSLLKFYKNVIFTRDIETNIEDKSIKEMFNYYDFKDHSNKIINDKSKIFLFDNIEGKDLFNLIDYSNNIISFHGMMTNLGSLNHKKVIDMWFCEINNYNDYKNYRNAFYEFKPNYQGYDFIIPSKNIQKTINKIKFAIKN